MNHVSAAPPAASGVPVGEEIRPPQPSPGAPGRIAADARLFAAMRFILALAALAIIYIDPVAPSSREALTYGILILYCTYAVTLLALASTAATSPDQRWLCAVDLVLASMLVLWTQGTDSIFFYVFLFPILVVSFSHGYRDGLIFTLASAAGFLVAGTFADPPITDFALSLTLMRPVYLLALGYMIAEWGGRQMLLRGRLMLLREVNATNTRADIDEVIAVNLRRILEFHDAERCVLALQRGGPVPSYVIHAVGRSNATPGSAQEMTPDSGARLLSFRSGESILYSARLFGRPRARAACIAVDRVTERESTLATAECAFVAALLETDFFVAVPYRQSDGTHGRMFLTSAHRRFRRREIPFLLQFTAAVSKVVESVQLLDKLVLSAAEHERVMISRDIHDAAVQPYIGLRLGLEALYRAGGPANPLSQKILDLIEMANATVRDLRGYTRGLLEGTEIPGGTLGAAIPLQAERHQRFYGLEITTEVDPASALMSGRFASQILHITVEALSNVVKHTASRRAFVEVRSLAGTVRVRIGNEQAPGAEASPDFVPKSIEARVQALGGALEVTHGASGYTVVQASIPK